MAVDNKSQTQNELETFKEELRNVNPEVKEYHCSNCGRFLCFQAIVEGTIAIKCRRCKEFNVLDIRQTVNNNGSSGDHLTKPA